MPDKNKQQNSNGTDVHSEKIRYGAPDGPRNKPRKYYDGREPLEFPGHEATAWFLAVPEALRDFKSISALARYFNVSRVTVYRWTRDIDVMKRADSLSMQNKIAGNLVARREYVPMMGKAVEMAKEGNIKAMEFCVDRAFPEDKRAEKSGLSSLSLEEVLERAEIEYRKHYETMNPTWLKERAKRLANEPVSSVMELMKQEAEPEAKMITPSSLLEQEECRKAAERKAAEERRASAEPENPPE
jgi:hypothetical protein